MLLSKKYYAWRALVAIVHFVANPFYLAYRYLTHLEMWAEHHSYKSLPADIQRKLGEEIARFQAVYGKKETKDGE
jgi:hypothetical protein